jgi:hypothetical protein
MTERLDPVSTMDDELADVAQHGSNVGRGKGRINDSS